MPEAKVEDLEPIVFGSKYHIIEPEKPKKPCFTVKKGYFERCKSQKFLPKTVRKT
jgi:hypothetical protein